MGEVTGIAWCHHTFNYVWGCSEITEECDNCYAREQAKRFGFPDLWSGQYRTLTDVYWKEPLRWNRAAELAGERRRVFTSSMADVFDMEAPEDQRARLFDLILHTTHLDWLILTKRPGQARSFLKRLWGDQPWKNVWLGVSAGLQKNANAFIPILLDTSAAVHFVSYEPALEFVDFTHIKCPGVGFMNALTGRYDESDACANGLDWVIPGGESGSKARPCDPIWLGRVVKQCQEANVKCFVKQMGTAWAKAHYRANEHFYRQDTHGTVMAEWPEDLRLQEFPR